ncbi:MAG: FtsW/RodA/SpoVE family cell cycle protein [Chloroflexota bacterium]|nr:FtsW/RodA/SpoVE family cell cycle protein [Chloroflexota bacterium]
MIAQVTQRRPTVRWTELRLLLAPSLLTVVGLLTIFLAREGSTTWTWSDISVSLMFVSAVAAISFTFGLLGHRGDQILLPVTAALAGLGLLMIQRLHPDLAAINPGYDSLALKQLVFLGIGLSVLWVSVVVVSPVGLLRRYKYTWLGLSYGLLVVTFLFGTEINGARLWLDVGPFQIQPSEIVKVTLVAFLAAYLDEKRDLLGPGAAWVVGPFRLPPIPYLLPMGLMWASSLAVLGVQNDLGSALLLFGIFLGMLYLATGRALYVVVGLGSFALACWAAYAAFARIGIRVQNWLDPWQDPLDSGYQQVQSDYALASGGLFGSGLGLGQPWYIPEVQTDFVFSAIGEELGLLGTLGILALYFLLTMRGYAIALAAPDGYQRLLAGGLTTAVGLQTLIIVGGVIRLIPLTGITLPFISYGGSSLLTNFLIVGLLLSISSRAGARPRTGMA